MLKATYLNNGEISGHIYPFQHIYIQSVGIKIQVSLLYDKMFADLFSQSFEYLNGTKDDTNLYLKESICQKHPFGDHYIIIFIHTFIL